MFNFSLINLWCTKNLVDSQYLIWKLLTFSSLNQKDQINYFPDPYDKEVEFVFLNTCGFLSSWRQEMMQTLKNLIDSWKKVYVFGCAIQYYSLRSEEGIWGQKSRKEVRRGKKRSEENNDLYEKEKREFEEFLKRNVWKVFLLSWNDLDYISIDKLKSWYNSKEFKDFVFPDSVRAYTDAIYKYEYLKIAEWCDNNCTFCIIPKIRWRQKSLPMEEILKEVENMVNSWIKEIIIISQDTTRYWTDLYGEPKLFELLEKIDNLDWDFVYRLLYLYPDIISLNHLKKFKNLKKFLPYFDIPLQHISSNVLKKMWRFYDTAYIYKFLDFIKKEFPSSFVRTNIIVWFPGETEEDFEQLKDFVKKWYFDNIALFEYHDEPLAASSKLPNKVDESTLKRRFLELSELVDEQLEKKWNARRWKQIGYVVGYQMISNDDQEDISRWYQEDLKIIVRPYLHAPEIDPYDEISWEQITWVYNETWEIQLGEMVEYVLK